MNRLNRRSGGDRWNGRIPIPKGCHPLVRKLIAECNKQGAAISELAEISGVSRGTITGWRYTSTPSLENLIACFNVLGFDLVAVEVKK